MDVVDPLVPHRNALRAEVDHSSQLKDVELETGPHLDWVPESHMSQREITGVHDASESPEKSPGLKVLQPSEIPDLVLLVLKKSFQSDGNYFDHILH